MGECRLLSRWWDFFGLYDTHQNRRRGFNLTSRWLTSHTVFNIANNHWLLCSSASLSWNFMWAESSLTSALAKTSTCVCNVTSRRTGAVIQTTTAMDCAADQRGKAWGALYQISFSVEALHSFLTFTVGSVCPLFRGLLALSLHWGPTSHSLEKPGASDLHCLAQLVCSVWPVPQEEESGPITSCRSETDMMSSSPLRHNRLQMRGAGPLGSLIHLTKKAGKHKNKK